ncbi:glycosyltransferase family 2 protein [Acidocella sp.]|uniref:glycosyltransferase family 2 protein n=1 Tax=Acidocella sp. TaxID=50710 RepID=UPI00260C7D0F|nr:glycosyltransferase family 2 protein [Acidocella sp.]
MRHDLAIAIATVCRPSLLRAVRSVFAQSPDLRLQVLIGVDADLFGAGPALRDVIARETPANVTVTWVDPGYSTSRRHGGPHACGYGGALRTVLSFLADARHVMYLDDDDWLAPSHCADIIAVLPGHKWAFAYSIYADGASARGLAVDELESVGVGRGVFAERFGGFVRPSGLALDKLALLHILHLWACSPFEGGDGEDRLIFTQLKDQPHACTGKATIFYALDPKDGMHPQRCAFIARRGGVFESEQKKYSLRLKPNHT